MLTVTQRLPVGTIIAYTGTNPEALAEQGWHLCRGDPVDAETLPELYKAIGTTWGSPGEGQFNLPNLRGTLLRMVSGDSGRDPDADTRRASMPGGAEGNDPGSLQDYGTAPAHDPFRATIANLATNKVKADYGCQGRGAKYSGGSETYSVSSGGNLETRPVNKYVHYLIKASVLGPTGDFVQTPVGGLVPYGGVRETDLNTDWTLCDGSALTVAGEFASLFSVVGYAHGQAGDGEFVLPDYRGWFQRGVDGGTGRDPNASTRQAPFPAGAADRQGNAGDAVGSAQRWGTGMPVAASFRTDFQSIPNARTDELIEGVIRRLYTYNSATSVERVSESGGDAESRPTNAYVDWYVRFRTQRSLPIGSLAMVGAALPPNLLWLPCDGRLLPIADWQGLFDAIGWTYGGSIEAGTFRLPDHQGRFLRGRDRGAVVDPDVAERTSDGFTAEGDPLSGDAMGTVQGWATAIPQGDRPGDPAPFFLTDVPRLPRGAIGVSGETRSGFAQDKGDRTIDTCTSGGDAETRPVNAYVLHYIKAA